MPHQDAILLNSQSYLVKGRVRGNAVSEWT